MLLSTVDKLFSFLIYSNSFCFIVCAKKTRKMEFSKLEENSEKNDLYLSLYNIQKAIIQKK